MIFISLGNMKVNGIVSTETMVAVTRDDAHRLIE
jgi:hypothetical protein